MKLVSKIFGTPDPEVKVIADFDKLIAQPIGFKFQGRIYQINPVDTETFMRIADSLGHIETLLKSKAGGQIKNEDVYKAYYDFIHPICPSLSLGDIKKLAVPQLFALLNLIIDHLTGKTPTSVVGDLAEAQKKNSTVHLKG